MFKDNVVLLYEIENFFEIYLKSYLKKLKKKSIKYNKKQEEICVLVHVITNLNYLKEMFSSIYSMIMNFKLTHFRMMMVTTYFS